MLDNRSLQNPERQLLKRHLGQKKTNRSKSSGIAIGLAPADANNSLRSTEGPSCHLLLLSLESGGFVCNKTMRSLHYRPIFTASLRADANRRIRSFSRRHLATFHHLDGNSGTGGCEPAIKIRSILERYRQDKCVYSLILLL